MSDQNENERELLEMRESFDRRPAMKKKRRGTGSAFALSILALLFAAVAGYCCISLAAAKVENTKQSAEIKRLSQDLKDATAISDDTLIPFGTIKAYSDEVVSLTEFMQRFYPDHMVYADRDNELVYQPVDAKLTRSTFDWQFLKSDPDKKINLKTFSDPNGVTALKGIDVSEHQGAIDWTKVKADGVEFAFLRAGLRGYESAKIFEDECLAKNLKSATAAGIPIGVYFYSQAFDVAEAEEEAEFVIEKVKDYKLSYPVVFDMEEENSDSSRTKDLTAAQRTDIAIAFCEKVKAAGYTPMIYGNMRFFAANLELSRLTKYQKWFAQYFSRPYYPYEFGIWQYTYEGRVDGISGNVDMNLGFVDYVKG
ncbi:MAG: glycoside hydrolase family 25 protein [Oscillospiraceae bacterium]